MAEQVHSAVDDGQAGARAPRARLSPGGAVLVLAFVAFGVVAAADVATGRMLGLDTFHVLILLAVTWFCGPWWGALFVAMASGVQLYPGLAGGAAAAAPAAFYVAGGSRLFAHLLVLCLTAGARTLYERAREAARIDYVTGIANSTGFFEKVAVEIARHRRSRAPFSIACFGCDYFKVINEALGRSEGDRVLRLIAQTVRDGLRRTDVVARVGGDEFAVVLPQTGEADARLVVRKLRARLEDVTLRQGWPLTFSVGVGVFPAAPPDVDRAVAFCERAMRAAQAAGRDRMMLRVFDPDEADAVRRRSLQVVR